MKSNYLLIYVFASIAVVGLIVSVYGIMNNPFILPYQDWDSMPDGVKKGIYQREASMNNIRNYGLATRVISGICFLMAIFLKTDRSVNSEDLE